MARKWVQVGMPDFKSESKHAEFGDMPIGTVFGWEASYVKLNNDKVNNTLIIETHEILSGAGKWEVKGHDYNITTKKFQPVEKNPLTVRDVAKKLASNELVMANEWSDVFEDKYFRVISELDKSKFRRCEPIAMFRYVEVPDAN